MVFPIDGVSDVFNGVFSGVFSGVFNGDSFCWKAGQTLGGKPIKKAGLRPFFGMQAGRIFMRCMRKSESLLHDDLLSADDIDASGQTLDSVGRLHVLANENALKAVHVNHFGKNNHLADAVDD